MKEDLGDSSTHKCALSRVQYDRDVNAAKNVFHMNVRVSMLMATSC